MTCDWAPPLGEVFCPIGNLWSVENVICCDNNYTETQSSIAQEKLAWPRKVEWNDPMALVVGARIWKAFLFFASSANLALQNKLHLFFLSDMPRRFVLFSYPKSLSDNPCWEAGIRYGLPFHLSVFRGQWKTVSIPVEYPSTPMVLPGPPDPGVIPGYRPLLQLLLPTHSASIHRKKESVYKHSYF